MKKILLVKITSMGDLIQMLPAITDATHAIPGIRFDWLCEDSFKEIPSLHPSVDKIITLPYRRWKKDILRAIKSGEIWAFVKNLRMESYDMVIDAQSNIKSASFAMFAKGKRYGLDAKSVREFGAHLTYHQTISISRQQNHVDRLRQMMAKFLGYPLPHTRANYGIPKEQLPKLDFPLPEKFVFVTAIASTSHKLWPERSWAQVVPRILELGYAVVLPWWSAVEKERMLALKNNHPHIYLLPPMDLAHKASVLSKARAAISLDTGLAHMAAALDIPNICLYGPVDVKGCGTVGNQQVHISAKQPACVPCNQMHCTYPHIKNNQSACMESISVSDVMDAFETLIPISSIRV